MIICSRCKYKNDDGTIYCKKCGKQLRIVNSTKQLIILAVLLWFIGTLVGSSLLFLIKVHDDNKQSAMIEKEKAEKYLDNTSNSKLKYIDKKYCIFDQYGIKISLNLSNASLSVLGDIDIPLEVENNSATDINVTVVSAVINSNTEYDTTDVIASYNIKLDKASSGTETLIVDNSSVEIGIQQLCRLDLLFKICDLNSEAYISTTSIAITGLEYGLSDGPGVQIVTNGITDESESYMIEKFDNNFKAVDEEEEVIENKEIHLGDTRHGYINVPDRTWLKFIDTAHQSDDMIAFTDNDYLVTLRYIDGISNTKEELNNSLDMNIESIIGNLGTEYDIKEIIGDNTICKTIYTRNNNGNKLFMALFTSDLSDDLMYVSIEELKSVKESEFKELVNSVMNSHSLVMLSDTEKFIN